MINGVLSLIGRENQLFSEDLCASSGLLRGLVRESRFLILGGAGSIGQTVTKEVFRRNPRKLHVVDISEDNLVELVRDIRSSFGKALEVERKSWLTAFRHKEEQSPSFGFITLISFIYFWVNESYKMFTNTITCQFDK